MRFLLFLALFAVAAASASGQSPAALTSPDYRVNLVRFEGVRTKPYRDKGGGWTVGVGHSLTAHRDRVKPRYTLDEIRDFYDRDLAAALRAARELVAGFDELPEPARELTVHLIWTCGPTGFARFKDLRFCLSHRMWNSARVQLLNSRWINQVQRSRAEWALNALDSL